MVWWRRIADREIEFSIQVYKVLNNEYSAWLIYSVSIRLFLTPTVWYIIIRISQVLCAFIDLKTKTHTHTLACIYMDRSSLSASAHHPVILFQCKSLSTHNSRGLGTPAAIISKSVISSVPNNPSKKEKSKTKQNQKKGKKIKTQADTKHGVGESGLSLFGKLERTRERKNRISFPTHLLNLPALPVVPSSFRHQEWAK